MQYSQHLDLCGLCHLIYLRSVNLFQPMQYLSLVNIEIRAQILLSRKNFPLVLKILVNLINDSTQTTHRTQVCIRAVPKAVLVRQPGILQRGNEALGFFTG